jgi:hypothetical protein
MDCGLRRRTTLPGTKGRSGGGNRLSAAEHRFRGTFRKDRHGKREQPSKVGGIEAPAHLDNESRAIFADLAARYQTTDSVSLEMASIHLLLHRRLYQRLLEADARRAAGETVDTQAVVRGLRQEAQTVRACLAGLALRHPEVEDDPDSWLNAWLNDGPPAGVGAGEGNLP